MKSIVLVTALSLVCGCAMVDNLTGEGTNREVRSSGLPARATVLEIWDTGVELNGDPVVGFRLQVEADGRQPWHAETRNVIPVLAIPQIQPGAVLSVRYDPADPARVAIVAIGEPPLEQAAVEDDEPPTLDDDLEVERIADGVWLHRSYDEVPGFGRVPANGLLVVSGDEAALIDTPWTADSTARLVRWARAELGATVTVVVPTHSHRDCLGGLAAAHAAGARSYALRRTGELAWESGGPVPQNLFTDRLWLRVGERTLQLHYAGPGHTEDTIVTWIPDVRVLFGGCLVRSAQATSLGYTAEADLDRWPTTVASLLEEYADAALIVPGHGRPGGRELLDHTLELVAAQAGAAGPESEDPTGNRAPDPRP